MNDLEWMRRALRLARKGFGKTSPNPMVGAVLVKGGRVIGEGWHERAGGPHAEIEAIRAARAQGDNPRGATLYVTLEPCSTFGRTPPCTDAIKDAGIRKVAVGAADPNPAHAGAAFQILQRHGIEVVQGILQEDCARLNEAFNHWILHREPFVTVKAALSLDGRIATRGGESKWITSETARQWAMKLRQGADAILVGANTILADDPRLTIRAGRMGRETEVSKRRVILDAFARTPLDANVASDKHAGQTLVFVSRAAPKEHVKKLAEKVEVRTVPSTKGKLDLRAILSQLGKEEITSLLVEGGGQVHGSFFMQRLVQKIAFFYAPKIIGGWEAPLAVAGEGFKTLQECPRLEEVQWRRIGPDLLLLARVAAVASGTGIVAGESNPE